MRSAIVVDGGIKSALSAVRSLGRAGVVVRAGAERKTGLALHSKYANRTFVYPSPYQDQRGFVAAVKAAALEAGDRPVIHAFSEVTFLTLYEYRQELAAVATLAFAPENAIDIAFNKAATYSEAKHVGVATIPTYLPERADELPRITSALSYPAVVKPRHSASWVDGQGVFTSAHFVHSSQELADTFTTLKVKTGEPPIIQPFIEGEEYGVVLLVDQGHVRAEAVQHRLRSLSPTGGASVLKETVDDSAVVHTMREYAYLLAEQLAWHGPMMVEFKVDNDRHEAVLMEINGRYVGSLPLTIAAGIDLPVMFHKLALGELDAGLVKAEAGVITRHWLGDVLHVLRVWLSHDPLRARLYPRRSKALKDFFRLPRGTKSDVWRWTDPLPAFFEIIDVIVKKL